MSVKATKSPRTSSCLRGREGFDLFIGKPAVKRKEKKRNRERERERERGREGERDRESETERKREKVIDSILPLSFILPLPITVISNTWRIF